MIIDQVTPGPVPDSINALLICPKCRMPACAIFGIDTKKRFAAMNGHQRAVFNEEASRQAVRQRGFPKGNDPSDQDWSVARLWPEPPKPRMPDNLPAEVGKAFLSGERLFGLEDMEEAAAGSYRRALDIGTKQIATDMPKPEEFEGKQLNNRIDMLRSRGRLTEDLAAWSHQIKGLGNEAMHAMDGITREELTALRGFTELVLTYLFTLPGMLAARKADADKAKG